MFIDCYHKIHKDQDVHGFLDYHSCAELENIIQYNISEVLEDNDIIYNDEIEYLCIYAHGSRVFGNPRKNSDIDFVLFYKGSIREDDLFNIFADENIYIEHIKCDFNPIQIDDDSDIEYYIQKHDIEYHQKPILEKKINLAFALDDFEDDELQGQTNSKVSHEHGTKEYLDAMEQFVDLCLPSGTLWCKYNLGAPISKMKDISHRERVDYIGGFYAWGEIEERFNNFTQQAYKFNYSEFNSKNLPLQNDAAYVSNNYPFKIYMPSYDDYNELKNNTTLEFKENYNGISGLNGIVYKSNVNDNELFIPNISYKQSDFDRDKTTIWDGSSFGCWTNTTSQNNEKAYMMYCSKTIWYGSKITYACNNIVVNKWYGAQIRPIIKKRG